ncbi:MAG: peptidase domain-containing ABC transporter [Parvibaculaceae bacterium]|nr:peptidase domain-containing ABC transporter [Parvibaculaceae bacterium]
MTHSLDPLHFLRRSQVPMIYQTEAAECGLACLAMVANFHGHDLDLISLRQRFSTSMTGLKLTEMLRHARSLGLTSRSLRLEPEDLKKLSTPAILHWDMNHFVVLTRVTSKWIYINNPATGMRRYRQREAGRHFTGVAMEFAPAMTFAPRRERNKLSLTSLWSRSSGMSRALAIGAVYTLVLQCLGLLSPFYVQLVIDEAIIKRDGDLLLVLACAFAGLIAISTFASALRDYAILHIGNRLGFQMSANLFRHLLYLPLSYFERRNLGDIISRFGSLEPIRQTMTTVVIASFADGLLVVSTFCVMVFYDLKLAAIVLASVMLYVLLRLVLFMPFRQLNEAEIMQSARQSTIFMETIRSIQSIKIFSRETERQALWENAYARQINAGARSTMLGISFQSINALLAGLENILVVYFAALLILADGFTIGMLSAFMAYKGQFSEKSRNLIEAGVQYYLLSLHLHRLSDIALAEPEFSPRDLTVYGREMKGKIEVRKCSFRYSESDPYIFTNMNLVVSAGEYVVLAGPSGCGKTTLLKMMMGLLLPEEGNVHVDDMPLRQYGLANYRAHVAAVMQEDHLMSGSIARNIACFDSEMDFGRISECAKAANLHEEIMQMPMGYESLIGDMGTILSGGQRQRLLIARALYRRPAILFLDEGTANLDLESERRISQTLQAMQITRIGVAHRPEMIRSADRVISMPAPSASASA